MIRLFFKIACLPALILVYHAPAFSQNIKADAGLQQSSLRIGEQTRLILTVKQPARAKVNFPQIGDSLVSKVQVLGNTNADTVADKNNPGQLTITKAYTITCFDAGTYTIPSYKFETGTGLVQTSPLTMQVTSVAVDTTKAIYDIKQPLSVNYTFLDWLKDNWLWILAGVFTVAAIAGSIYYYKNRPKKEVIPEETKPLLPAYQIAINQLQALRDKQLWQQNEVKQYYIELTDILRDYLGKRYFIKTHEKTTEELLVSLAGKDINHDSSGQLKQLLVLADLVKFAKFKPVADENEQNLDSAVNFVLNTKPVEMVKAAEGGTKDV